ncbi:lytic transglycosylase domain-containing protein [Algivirga pacifica]|uniref:Lytic transglycosylase domain-containing protein n=1 Tax=Algivirga pacifica TaxID=1162670 RepID=A0ABP9D971_9BACT
MEEKQKVLMNLKVPQPYSFCDEPVNLKDIDVQERFERELYVNTFWHSNTILLLKRAHRWLPVIAEILKEEDVPEDFKFLPLIESGLTNVTSPAGASGYWQFLKSTAKDYGLTVNKEVDERYHVQKATRAACHYLKKAKERLGSWTLAAAAYNRGVTGIERALEDQQAENYYDLLLNEETSRYVFRILAIKEIYRNPQKYGFPLYNSSYYTMEDLKYQSVSESVGNLASFAKSHGISYKLLKRYNPWLRKNKLTVNKGTSYLIALPK